MGMCGLSVLLLAVDCVDVSLDVDCMSSLDVEHVSLSLSESELVDFLELLVGLLDFLYLQDAEESAIDSGIRSSACCTAG